MKLAHFFLLFVICTKVCRATHEQDVVPDSIIYDVERYNLNVKVSVNENRELSNITVVYKNVTFTVPKEEMQNCGKDYFLSRLRISIPVGSGTSKISGSEMDFFSIIIPFGHVTVNEVNGEEIHSFNMIRFEFVKGKLSTRERVISGGDDKNSWNLYLKGFGNSEQSNGAFIGPKNPLEN
jgi:hypothetical protein